MCDVGRLGDRDCPGRGGALVALDAADPAGDAPGRTVAGGMQAGQARCDGGGAIGGVTRWQSARLPEQKHLLQAAEQAHQNGRDQGLHRRGNPGARLLRLGGDAQARELVAEGG